MADNLLHLFRVGLTKHTPGIYLSAISAFLAPHCYQKASNRPIIYKLMCYFYLWYPPSCKHVLDIKHLLSLLESWNPAPSLTNFRLTWSIATLLVLVWQNVIPD